MNAAHAMLLEDCRAGLRRQVLSCAVMDTADRVFAAWLLSPNALELDIEAEVQGFLDAGVGSYREVAALGFMAALKAPELPFRSELKDGLVWLLSRPRTVSGNTAAFVTDPIGILGVSLALAHLADDKLTESGRRWIAELSEQFARNPTAEPWELCLVAAGRYRVGLSVAGYLPDSTDCADCRVALHGRGAIPPPYPVQRDQDESVLLRIILQEHGVLPWHVAVIRAAGYDTIRREAVQNHMGTCVMTAPTSTTPSRPKTIFISYSWESDEHQKRVIKLANDLRRYGFESVVDVAHPSPAEGLPAWMLNQIRRSDFVLLVCTETYRRRCEGEEKPGVGLGVKWEGGIISRSIYLAESRQRKFIPVVFGKEAVASIPLILAANTYYNVGTPDGMIDLVRLISDQPAYVLELIGQTPVLPPIDVA